MTPKSERLLDLIPKDSNPELRTLATELIEDLKNFKEWNGDEVLYEGRKLYRAVYLLNLKENGGDPDRARKTALRAMSHARDDLK